MLASVATVTGKGRHKNSLSLATNIHKMLQNHLEGSVTQSVIFAYFSQNLLGPVPIHYIVI